MNASQTNGMPNWSEASVLITGGTGSFGSKFVDVMLSQYRPRRLVVFSRDELKQAEMMARLQYRIDHPSLRFFVGDVRDQARLERAMQGVDVVFHAAALKQITSCEYNPFEAVKTNVIGAENVISAAIAAGVRRVIMISTDKAVNPINLYGATKLCAEKLFVQGNAYGYARGSMFSVVRYGNVIGSRGSVIPLFAAQRSSGTVTVTDAGMTRFWIRLEEGVAFAIRCAEIMGGGEIFVPKIPSMRILDLVEAVAPGCRVEFVGIRPGEKLHEVLIAEEEGRQVLEFEDMFLLEPIYPSWACRAWEGGKRPGVGFHYSSDTNPRWLSPAEMGELARE